MQQANRHAARQCHVIALLCGLMSASMAQAQPGVCLANSCPGAGVSRGAAQSTTSTVFTPSVPGTLAGEYNTYNVTMGMQYEWSLCPSDGAVNPTPDAQLSLKLTSNFNLCFSDDVCGLAPKILWVADYTQQVRVLVNQSACATNGNAHTVVWRCLTCGPPPVGADCTNPFVIGSFPHASSGTSCGLYNNYGSQCTTAHGAGEDVVHRLDIPSPGAYSITLASTDATTNVIWYLKSAAACANATSCLALAASGNTTVATNSYAFTSAGSYYLIVDNYPGPSCFSFSLSIDPVQLPDPCTSSIPIAVCGNSQATSLAGSSAWSAQTLCGAARSGQARIFSFVPLQTGNHSVTVLSNNVTSYSALAWSASCSSGSTWNCIASIPAASALTYPIGSAWNAGNTYFIMLRGETALTMGSMTLRINCPPAANDQCANAQLIGCNDTADGTTGGATTESPSPGFCGVSIGAPGVWYKVMGVDGTMTASTCANASYDTKLQVYRGLCGAFICVGGNDDSCGSRSQVNWTGSAGTMYYILVNGFLNQTGTFTLTVSSTGDSDGDAIANCEDSCPNLFGEIGDACDDGDAQTAIDYINGSCACAGAACTTDLDFVYQADGADDLDWVIYEQGTNLIAKVGGGALVGNGSEATCLPDGCFYLVVTDGGGDGIVNGGYLLKVNSSARLIDNLFGTFGEGGFTSGGTSHIAANEGFCLPVGTDRLIYTSCDKRDWRISPCMGEYMVADDNAAVSAEYGVNNANSGYQMWWYAPHGGYSFKRFQSHNTSNGLPASATRACHFKLNSWAGNQLVEGSFYNVKVRGRVNGVYNQWGPACRLVVNSTEAQCPRTKLMDIPGNPYLSCGQQRAIGTNVYVHARPVKRMNANCTYTQREPLPVPLPHPVGRIVDDREDQRGGPVLVREHATASPAARPTRWMCARASMARTTATLAIPSATSACSPPRAASAWLRRALQAQPVSPSGAWDCTPTPTAAIRCV
jgi:hypothetical protein